MTGSSGGWIPVSFDLTAFAGQNIELVVSYVTDPSTGGLGVIIDDTKLVTTGGVSQAEGFETGLGAWQVLGAPETSPDNLSDWERTPARLGRTLTAGVATEDTRAARLRHRAARRTGGPGPGARRRPSAGRGAHATLTSKSARWRRTRQG